MSKLEAKNKIKKIIIDYLLKLQDHNLDVEQIYLFGSHVNGNPGRWSDIDVALISNNFEHDFEKKEDMAWHFRRYIDTRIEPHLFSRKDFDDEYNPMALEIKKNGIKIK